MSGNALNRLFDRLDAVHPAAAVLCQSVYKQLIAQYVGTIRTTARRTVLLTATGILIRPVTDAISHSFLIHATLLVSLQLCNCIFQLLHTSMLAQLCAGELRSRSACPRWIRP